MRSKLTLFAAVCGAALALSSSASAATILQFTQQNSVDVFNAVVVGSSTTLNTNGGVGSSNSIPITITQLGVTSGLSIPAFETFLPALVSTASTSAGVQFGFNGTIIISSGFGGTGTNILTTVITNGRLDANGGAGGFNAANFTTNGGNPTTVTLIYPAGAISAAVGPGPQPGAVSLSLVNLVPVQSGAGFVSFQGQNTGNFATVSGIPEPASFLSASTAIVAGLGCFGWSRRKSSKA